MFRDILKPLFVCALLLSFAPVLVPAGGAPSRSDQVNNDTWETATEIIVSVDPIEENLDPEDVDDYFRILNLVGDTDNDQLDAQRLTLGIKKVSGSNVRGIFFEPNGLKIAELYSDGEREELEFIIPRDGDYTLWVQSDPRGATSSYEIYLGGATGVDNRPYDKNNDPPGIGVSGSVNISNSLDPLRDVVDYWSITVPPNRAVEATMFYLEDLTFRMQIMNSTYYQYKEVASDSPFRFENNGDTAVEIIYRVYLPLSTSGGYPGTAKTYNLNIELWSHLTRPEVSATDPWNVLMTNEDSMLVPNINLTKHFTEKNGDPLTYRLISEPENLEVRMIEQENYRGDVIYVEAEVTPLPNWHGTEVLQFRATDRDGSVTDNVTIEVASINDLPYVTRIGNADYKGGTFSMFALEDMTRVYTVEYQDDDHDLEDIHFSITDSPSFLSLETSNGTMTITPVQADEGTYEFTLNMMDPEDSVPVPIFLDVQGVNDPPLVPTIRVVKGNITGIVPGEEIILEAIVGPDPDGDDLTFTWSWGDTYTDQGKTASHIYDLGIYGRRTVNLTVSDGRLSSYSTIEVFLERPEDLADGDLVRVYAEPKGDVVKTQEEWRVGINENDRDFNVETINEPGVDIIYLSCGRRGNSLEITLKVQDSIEIDGSFRYYIYVMVPPYSEPFVDFRNLTEWSQIPSRLPVSPALIAYREYLGDPALHNTSTGTIVNENSLIWLIPFTELASGGMEFPIHLDNFTVFAVSEHVLEYGESKGISERYVMTDTAGGGALAVDEIKLGGSTSGGGGSNFADLSRPTQIGVIVGLIVLLAVLAVTSTILLRRWIKQKKKEEKEFIDHVEKLNAEGKDLFGKEKKTESVRRTPYDDLYGGPSMGTQITGQTIGQQPVIVLDIPAEEKEKILDLKVGWDDEE
ncbi:MAG: PKD domain-containing protein [Thermoplasmatota archaeon]